MQAWKTIALSLVAITFGVSVPLIVGSLTGEFSFSSPPSVVHQSPSSVHDTSITKRAPLVAHSAFNRKRPRAVQGKVIYELNCAPCHQLDGLGNADYNAPALAGQHEWYVVRQLRHFKDGTRGTHPEDYQALQMAPVLRLLSSDRDIRNVAAYIAKMVPFETEPQLHAVAEKGKSMFVGTCLPCHGSEGLGNQQMNAPRLAGQADWYLARQLTKFKQGIRGAHKDDVAGMQMATMAKTLMDEESIKNLAAYINGLNEVTSAKDDTVKVVSSSPEQGKNFYQLNCTACHRQDGLGDPEFNAPALAGQHDWYLVRQLQNFKSGTRGAHPEDFQGMQMAPLATLLKDDQAIQNVVAHISELTPFQLEPTLDGNAGQGKTIFVGSCQPCHGAAAGGNPILKAPRLAGQADWYLVRQLTKFKTGIRGAHKEDTEGMQMAAMAKSLMSEQAIKDVAAYINSLGK